MSWWDRLVRWWRAVMNTRVVVNAHATAPMLSEADRAWVRGLADALDAAPRVGNRMVEIGISDELARAMAARLRGLAGSS